MFVDFETLAKDSKIWIYQSNRRFNDEEITTIKKRLIKFIDSWRRHGDKLKSSFKIKYNQFIILAVDESFNNVSGCSVDESIHFIKQLEKDFNTTLLDRMSIAYKDCEDIKVVEALTFKKSIEQQKINKHTTVFNNLVNTLKEFNENWETSVEKSWQSKYLI